MVQSIFSEQVPLEEGMIYTIGFSSRASLPYRPGLFPEVRSNSANHDYYMRVNAFKEGFALDIINGNTAINGSLTIQNQYTFPTTDGTSGQVLTSDGAGNINWSDNANADNQTIDVLNLNGNTLEISLQDDGQAPHTLDLSSFNSVKNIIQDGDADTKINVEQAPDHDVIKFDVGGNNVLDITKTASGHPIFNVKNGTNFFFATGEQIKNSGYGNIFMGKNTGLGNNAGFRNVYIGDQVARHGDTGTNNTIIGALAGHNINGSLNVMLGSDAGRGNISGSQNVFVGNQAGFLNEGSNNVFLGDKAGKFEVGSNRLYIDNAGTNDPLIYGEFDNDLARINGNAEVTGSLKIGNGGTAIGKMRAGRAHIGSKSGGGVKSVTINYGSSFSSAPKVVVTPITQGGYNDMFVTTIKSIGNNSFTVNVYRVDAPGGGWGQQLKLDWVAWQ
ncbi:MAG: hypothetical protein AAF985_20955 [Bacteroidota bacterium]